MVATVNALLTAFGDQERDVADRTPLTTCERLSHGFGRE
jgi:hypothetical protein